MLKIFDGIAARDRVAALGLPARHQVVALVELRQQAWDLGGVVLEVTVNCHDDVACRFGEAGVERGCLAEVPSQANDADVVVGVVEASSSAPNVPSVEPSSTKTASQERPSPGERGRELVVEQRDAALLVVHGDDDRDHAARVPATNLV